MDKRVVWSSKYKKDFKLAAKRGLNTDLLSNVVKLLATTNQLPEEYKDHELSGNWKGFRECHIQPDWLLIYIISADKLVLTLVRTGTHSDLF